MLLLSYFQILIIHFLVSTLLMSALIVIDIQNDYFEGGAFPLWNTDETLQNILKAVEKAQEKNMKIILVQHVAAGPSIFFNKDTKGAEIHSSLNNLKNADVVIKEFSDSFYKTNLEEILAKNNVKNLLVCGMMT